MDIFEYIVTLVCRQCSKQTSVYNYFGEIGRPVILASFQEEGKHHSDRGSVIENDSILVC